MGISGFFRSHVFVPSAEQRTPPPASDDECLSRLASAVAEHDDRRLNEVAQLIGRLAVPIEEAASRGRHRGIRRQSACDDTGQGRDGAHDLRA